jgi:hypothetical protein
MLVRMFRVIAVLVALPTAIETYFAMWFRFDTLEEFDWVKNLDVVLGGAFALAFSLFFLPGKLKKPKVCSLVVGIAVLIWLSVSGYLLSLHEWQYRVRFTTSAFEAREWLPWTFAES